MSTTLNIPNCDVSILARIIQPERGDLPLAAARAILKFAFDPTDQERMDALMVKARAGTLTDAESSEMDDYERVIHLLGMMHSKARRSMKKHANGR
ncbi:MAG: hypothetical protein HY289_06130 [Planctomycetes bacterium]|nr:hypothetical protein [Planctomycetota bacterium]